MQGTTLAIGILASILVLLLRPAYALAAYFSVLVWYPDYLRVSIGTIDISAGRIVITILLLRCLCDDRLRRKFTWSRLDTWVAFSMAIYVVIYCITHPLQKALENRGGFLMDTWLVYLVARFCITDRAELVTFVKSIAVILVPLAILGAAEAITGQYYFIGLSRFCVWRTSLGDATTVARRWGLGRANGPFSHSIMFGSCFVMFLPLIWALRRQRGNWASLAKWLSAMAVLGALSSVSSGPWGMLMVVVFCLILERYPHRLKGILMLLIVLCVLSEIGSNRRFYCVALEAINLGKGDWWSRARLIDAAIDNFGEWWLAGYGGIDPGWGSKEGGYFWGSRTDVNNQFILVGMEAGFFAIIALCGVLVVAFRGLVRAFKETADKELRSLYWAMGSALVGVIAVWQGVNFFGQMNALFYLLFGIVSSSLSFAKCATAGNGRLLGSNNTNLILST